MLRSYSTTARNQVPAKLTGLITAAVFVFTLALFPATSQAEQLNDIIDQVDIEFDPIRKGWKKRRYHSTVVVTNTSASEINGPIRIAITAFKNRKHFLVTQDGVNDEGYPYIEIDLPNGVLGVGESTEPRKVIFGKMSKPAYKKFKKRNKAGNSPPITDPNGPGWSEHDFPIKFIYQARGNPPPLELIVTQPDAFPGAVKISSGLVPVRFTTSLVTEENFRIGPVVLEPGGQIPPLNNANLLSNFFPDLCPNNECQIPLNDDGINGDLEANDGIYSFEKAIDSANLTHGQCVNLVATVFADAAGGAVSSDPLLFCATKFPTELVDTDISDNEIIPFGEAQVVGNQFLLRFDPAVPTAGLEKIVGSLRGAIIGTQLEDGFYQIAFDRVFSPEEYSELFAGFQELEGVTAVDPNYVGEFTAAPSDPEFPNQHGLQLVSADDLGADEPRFIWEAGATGAGMRIVLLDSGVNQGLADDLNPQFELPKDVSDVLGHGTKMAGIAVAPTDNETAVSSIAPDARVRAVRISKTNSVTLSKMLEGFKRAKGYASRTTVISASFSIKNMLSDGGVCRKIHQIINRGAIVVVSAGNDDLNSATGIVPGNCNSPAFDPFTNPGPVSSSNKNKLIVVGATSCTSGACETEGRWPNSNRGSWVDIGAPGINLPTIDNNGIVTTVSGTSPAASLVAGAAAVLRSCEVGGPVTATDSTLALSLDDVFNAMDIGAFTPVSGGLPSRLNVYHALASVNTVPTAISLTVDNVLDGIQTEGGLSFSEVNFTDDTVCDAHTIQITGGADAEVFSIGGDLGNELVIDDGTVDISRQSSYEVEITVNDFFGGAVTQLFNIAVIVP